MNNLLIISIIFFNMLFICIVKADSLSEKNMANLQLALFTLSKGKSFSPVIKSSASEKKSKSFDLIYPTNCLKWSAIQINRKAEAYSKYIMKYSRLYQVDSNLIKSIITAESCFRVKALSHKGASGLMQLIPATAERFGVNDIYNSEQNIRGGTKYLKFLLKRFKGDLKKSIAGYNAGEGAVDRYNGIPPYRETKQYVKNVLKIYRLLTPPKKKKIIIVKKVVAIKKVPKISTNAKQRVHAVYQPKKIGNKPGRHGWQYNRRLAPHLYKH